MLFTTLPQVALHISNTHMEFAGTPWKDKVLPILGSMNAQINKTAMVGATFEAVTDIEHGELQTLITIEKLNSGLWEVTEVLKAE